MSDVSDRLALPYLMPAQAQKHVTHNEALRMLDLLVQLTVEGFGAETPPAAPDPGEAHALGSAPTGDWAGHAGEIAVWNDGAWSFAEPREGWIAAERGQAALRIRAGGLWVTPEPAQDGLDRVGIGTAADAVNRLSVAAAATLLSHAGAGHRLKVNKAGPADTASLLFQSDFSGRAEMGLAGEDAFSVKVSPDGAAWQTALRIGAADGRAQCPGGIGTGGFLNLGPARPVTIAGGTIAASGSFHAIETEGGAASDRLDTITGGQEGDLLILRAAGGRTVIVANGQGNIACGQNRPLSGPAHRIVLQNVDGAHWAMLSYSAN